MNYIKRLERENSALKQELHELRRGLQHLKGYLQSEKFWHDTTVQTSDVLLRLDEAEREASKCQY